MKQEIKLSSIKNFIDIEGLKDDDVIVRKSSEGMLINEQDEKTFTATISDTSIDQDGDCVYSSGCDIRTIMKNPILLWSHSHSSPPVGKILGLNIQENKIEAKIKMADTQVANELWSLIKGGFLRTNSIGFIVKRAVYKGTREFSDFVQKTGLMVSESCNRIITDFVLIENSLCSIPCNGNALIESISTKSIVLDSKLIKELGIKDIPQAVEVPKVEVPATLDATLEIAKVPVEEPKATPTIPTTPVNIAEPVVKPSLDVVEETYKPTFVILRAGDYIPTQDDVKAFKSGKILVVG